MERIDEKLPNLLIFNPDSWRGDVLGHMNMPGAKTPNLDALARNEGVSFKHAYCQCPVCTPSRCSFMTGWYPHVRGHRTMHHMLHPERGEPNLLAILKEAGYFIWWGGKNDLVPGQDAKDPEVGIHRYCDIKFQPTKSDWKRWNRCSITPEGDWRGNPGSDTYYSFMQGKIKSIDEYLNEIELSGEIDEESTREEEPVPGIGDRDWGNVLGAIDFIKSYSGDKPLCIVLTLGFPHPQYRVEEPFYSMIDRSTIASPVPPPGSTNQEWIDARKPSILMEITNLQNLRGWSEERWKELRAVYFGMCARVDHQFGMIIEALKERKTGPSTTMHEETAVFFFSDHGDYTGDYGLVEKTQNTFEEPMVRVPFLFKPPAWMDCKPGTRDAMVELVDFPATVFEITGIEPGYWHFGKSLVHLLGKDEKHRDAVFCEGGRLKGETQAMERESNGSTNMKSLYWPRLSLQGTEWDENDGKPMYHTKAAMCRTMQYKYIMRLYETDELYDLEKDPGETTNLIKHPDFQEKLHEMERRLLRHYMETCDVVPMDPDQRVLMI